MKRIRRRDFAVLIAILISVVYVMYQSPIMDRYNSSKYKNIDQFRNYFLSQYPQGTSESEIDKLLVEKMKFRKSEPWYHTVDEKKFVITVHGKSEDHYQITYLYIQGYYKQFVNTEVGYTNKPSGYYFTLKYSLDGELLDIQSKGTFSRHSKGRPLYINRILNKGELDE